MRYALALLAALLTAQLIAGVIGILRAHGPVTAPVDRPVTLANSGGFEAGLRGWHDTCGGCGEPVLSPDRSRHKFGRASLKVVASAPGQAADFWNVPVHKNTAYTFSAWVYQRTGSAVTIRLRCGESTGFDYQHLQDFAVPSGRWTRLALTFTTSSGVVWLAPNEIMNEQNGPLTYWVDGVRLDRVRSNGR